MFEPPSLVYFFITSASKFVDNIVLILLARPDHAAGEQGLVDAVRELLGLQAEPTMLPEHGLMDSTIDLCSTISPIPNWFLTALVLGLGLGGLDIIFLSRLSRPLKWKSYI